LYIAHSRADYLAPDLAAVVSEVSQYTGQSVLEFHKYRGDFPPYCTPSNCDQSGLCDSGSGEVAAAAVAKKSGCGGVGPPDRLVRVTIGTSCGPAGLTDECTNCCCPCVSHADLRLHANSRYLPPPYSFDGGVTGSSTIDIPTCMHLYRYSGTRTARISLLSKFLLNKNSGGRKLDGTR
jgi:hypothetical protein